ncbi:hypothetical protein L2E82_36308 [Cichorium intybus]|uniref:Uncharacterized protein n=1 Tax=Cichorium intybus TaxID=13427 RepID=A0ACB9BRA8_CICIN|nr:hypothetical protein L2E82_36308 [Cichorium intybus]
MYCFFNGVFLCLFTIVFVSTNAHTTRFFPNSQSPYEIVQLVSLVIIIVFSWRQSDRFHCEVIKKEEMTATTWNCRNLAVSLHSNLHFHHHHHRNFLNHGPDTVEELLERHVVKKQKSYNDDEDERLTRQRLTTTRREVLALYRDIIRATRFFVWSDSRGVLWRDVLRANARREFEEARFEKDPEVITRLLIGGHDAVQAALDKLVEKQREQIAKEKADRDSR